METGHPLTRAVNSGSGNRALLFAQNYKQQQQQQQPFYGIN